MTHTYSKLPSDNNNKNTCHITKKAHEQTGLGAVVLIDEYDKPILDVLDMDFHVEHLGKTMTLEEKHRNILKSFYATLKCFGRMLRMALICFCAAWLREV